MKIIDTSTILPTDLSEWEKDQVYNGLDCCVTYEVLDALLPQLDNHTAATYNFSRSLQGPVLEMRLRGILVDQRRKSEVIEEYFQTLERLEAQLIRIVGEGWGLWEFKWSSPKDLAHLFYDVMGIPPIRKRGRPTTDRDALEKMGSYFQCLQLVNHLLALRDLAKKLSALRTEIDDDGRMRTSYNIAGTTTGRLSSSFSEFGTGTNLQNIEESLRSIFIADPGYKMAYIDAQQGESRVVGAIEVGLFNDSKYLDACESGDLHTNVARLVWPNLAWTNRPEDDRILAEQPYYRHYDRRFMCKKIGHGTNYGGKPGTLATQAQVEVGLIEEFQPKYFRAFPAHLRWHGHVRQQLAEFGYLISLTGRKRWFFGRRNDDATIREAIAFDPQGSLADILNTGMLAVWERRDCQLLMQVHDAILIQYPEESEDEVIPKVLDQLRVPLTLEGGRQFEMPYDVATGWNWGKWNKDKNVDGLKKWKGGDQRKRTPQAHLLDTRFRRLHSVSGKRTSFQAVGGDINNRSGT